VTRDLTPLRLRGRRPGLIRLLVLPPAAIAALGPLLETAVRRSVAADTLVFSAMMLAIAGLGLFHELTRQVLVADEDGVCWSRGIRRTFYPWSNIEEIGVARLACREAAFAGAPVAGGGRAVPDVGLKLAGGRSQDVGPYGYDVILTNDFGAPTEEIVQQLRSRWRRQPS
jgi:hypothetical protein